jgi:hypothetical protein
MQPQGYDLAITELLRYSIGEVYKKKNQFHNMLGSIQEFFLKELLENRLPELEIIPETKYKDPRTGSDYDGPDFVLIENNRLIAIESKSKHITLDTRIEPHSEQLMTDLESSFNALKKLAEEKIPDLYSDIDEYKPYQEAIDKTKTQDKPPICIIIIGLGTFFMQEIIAAHKNKNPSFLLNKFQDPYCIIDLLSFTRAVEIAAAQNVPLYSLLEEYWRVADDNSPKQHTADAFGGRSFEAERSFLHGYFYKLFEKIKPYKNSTQ